MRLDEITNRLSAIINITCEFGLDTTLLWTKGDLKETFIMTSLAALNEKVFLDGSLNSFRPKPYVYENWKQYSNPQMLKIIILFYKSDNSVNKDAP
jgi:hypothetical protein